MRMQQIGSWPPAVFALPQKADVVRHPKDEERRRRAVSDHGAAPAEPETENPDDVPHDRIDIVV